MSFGLLAIIVNTYLLYNIYMEMALDLTYVFVFIITAPSSAGKLTK